MKGEILKAGALCAKRRGSLPAERGIQVDMIEKELRFDKALRALSAPEVLVLHHEAAPSASVVGFMVAYAAMFGFDKLKQALEGGKWTK